jgi:carbonic anhydrase/acetyltransferase-like protein (isoleucine patch superfamily)
MKPETGTPDISKSAVLFRGAVVEGSVTIGDKTTVWYNAVIRGDFAPITIGEGTNVQDCAVIHADAGQCVQVGNRVTIGHGALLHGCVVEDDALIGMNAVVLDGAVVEKGAMIGAGSLVKHGQRIPAGVIAVGTPARVLRPLTEAEKRDVRQGADFYISLGEKQLLQER